MELILCPFGQEKVTEQELSNKKVQILEDWGRLKLIQDFAGALYFTQARAKAVEKLEFQSIKEAQNLLRKRHSHWGLFSVGQHRRAALVQEELRSPPLIYKVGAPIPQRPCGLWTMPSNNTLYAGISSHPAPLGEAKFDEDHVNPPSRAYLKLWELFTFHLPAPAPKSKVLDLGACPGGWSWALAESFGCEVLAIDRSPLDKRLMSHPQIKFLSQNAFAVDPLQNADRAWVLSDVICYPDKLFEYFSSWDFSKQKRGFVGTLKFQAETDFETIEKFASVPNSHLVHLFANKHELTWFRAPGLDSQPL